MKKLGLILILLLVLPSVLADGMIIDPIGPVLEKQQLAAINYDNGLQRMILTIETDELRSEKSAWIFPVPAGPEDTVIDIVKQFPRFYGREVTIDAKRNIEDTFRASTLSQIYPFFFLGGMMYAKTSGIAEGAVMTGVRIEKGQTVIVYEHIEKEGMITELLGAETGLDLYAYLRMKGLEVPMTSIRFLRDYTGRGYTFVVSWISDIEKVQEEQQEKYPGYYPYKGRRLGVEIMFPTDKIYFPLIPTSVYGSEKVPIKIYVLDFVKPELYEELEGFSKVEYYKYSAPYGVFENELASFYGSKIKFSGYTVINIIDAPSKYLREDLWMKKGTPVKIKYANFINGLFGNELIGIIIWLALVSMLAGLIAGLIIFRDAKKFALVGLANCFSIIGLIIAVIFIKTKKIDVALKRRLKQAGLITIGSNFGKKVIFIVLFSVLFLVLGWLISLVLKLPF